MEKVQKVKIYLNLVARKVLAESPTNIVSYKFLEKQVFRRVSGSLFEDLTVRGSQKPGSLKWVLDEMETTRLVDFNIVHRRLVNGTNFIHNYGELLIHLNTNSPVFAMECANLNIAPDVGQFRNQIVQRLVGFGSPLTLPQLSYYFDQYLFINGLQIDAVGPTAFSNWYMARYPPGTINGYNYINGQRTFEVYKLYYKVKIYMANH